MVKLVETVEQKNIIEQFLQGHHLAIVAGAGAGKTTLMIELGYNAFINSPSKTVYYNTLNKANAEEVKKKFKSRYSATNVEARTMHSLAYQAMIRGIHAPLMQKLNSEDSLRQYEYNKVLHVPGEVTISVPLAELKLNITRQINIALTMVDNFCKSADTEIAAHHMPFLEILGEKNIYQKTHKEIAKYIIPIANRAWNDITSVKGRLKFSHDHYLKIFQLSNPVIGKPGDIILYDEAQDVKDAVADILLNQKDRQLVFVGDNYQNIYRFIGSSSILRELSHKKSNVVNLPLSKSWRFGNNVADLANAILRYIGEENFKIEGNEARKDNVKLLIDRSFSNVDAVIFRSNAALIETLIEQIDIGRKVSAVINKKHIFNVCDDIELMMNGKRPKKVVELKDFDSFGSLDKAINGNNKDDLVLSDASLYRIVISHGPVAIRDAIEAAVTLKDADLVLSTIHKAKGLEWDRVAVVFDAKMPILKNYYKKNEYGEQFYGDELDMLMLLYVAVTRAKSEMYVEHFIFSALGYEKVKGLDVNRIAVEKLVNYIYNDAELVFNGNIVAIPQSWVDLKSSYSFNSDIDRKFIQRIERIKDKITRLNIPTVITDAGGTISANEFVGLPIDRLNDPTVKGISEPIDYDSRSDAAVMHDTEALDNIFGTNNADELKIEQIQNILDDIPEDLLDIAFSRRKSKIV